MFNNLRNTFILVICLFILDNVYAGRWVNWEPLAADISHGINTVIEAVGDIKKSFISKQKKDTENNELDELHEEETSQIKHVSITGIDTIKVSGAGSLLITQNTNQGEEFVIEYAQDIPEINVCTDNNTLIVVLKDKASFWSPESIVYRVNIATLSKIEVADTVSVEISNINVPALSVEASGSSTVSGQVSAHELIINSSDTCGVTLSGCADTQTVRISGNGVFDGRNLDGKTIAVDASGSAYLYCNVSEAVTGSLLGSGSLIYAGSPVVDIDSSQKACVRKL